MEAITAIKERRSVRKYKDEIVDRELLKEIVEAARFAPSWTNVQIARYTIIDNPSAIEQIAEEGVNGFAYNAGTLKNTKGVCVLSYVQGKSGKYDGEFVTSKGDLWETFDAGIACQTFCLAAHAKGLGTCIFGIIDDEVIGKIANLPENETVAALITFGYPDEEPKTPRRKEVEDLIRFV